MEYGATVIGCDASTLVASSCGMFPFESTAKILPVNSIVWLCRSPSLAVRWYSSLVRSSLLTAPGMCLNLFPWAQRWCFRPPELATLGVATTWAVVFPLRLISSSVIPSCQWHFTQIHQVRDVTDARKDFCRVVYLLILLHSVHMLWSCLSLWNLWIKPFSPLVYATKEHCKEKTHHYSFL